MVVLGSSCVANEPQPQQTFRLGIDQLMRSHTQRLAGYRVGLITNQTGLDSHGNATIDLLHNHPDINLVALFSPEHGIRGKAAAGEHVDDTADEKTGLPVYSLYGAHGHHPTPTMLELVDILVYDIQDVGSRAYTYIWTMAECMEAAAEAKIPFVVLDRPNPLGGRVVDGPVTEPRWKSFLGLYPIPRVYGLTCGELARYFNQEQGLEVHLMVIPMSGYRRDMSWAETGLTWKPSSPNIPTPESAVCFAATGTIGTLGFIDIGIGTDYPFQLIGAPWMNAEYSAAALNERGLTGVRFVPHLFERRGRQVQSVFLQVTDPTAFFPTLTEVVILQHLQQAYPDNFKWPTGKAQNSFDKAMGTESVRKLLAAGRPIADIQALWRPQHERFRERRRAYIIYP